MAASRLAAAALVLGLAGCGRQRQVWFAPNLGSPDMLELFDKPDRWPRARAELRVFKFYDGQILADDVPCPACGPNRLANFAAVSAFSRLQQWGIGVAVEVPVLKVWDCTADLTAPMAEEVVRRVAAHGGAVDYLALDEPLLGGEVCGLGAAESASRVRAFVSRLRRGHPGLAVGDIEPYPVFGAERLAAWVLALDSAEAPLAFFHLDVDRVLARRIGADVGRDLDMIRTACAFARVPFGIIFWGDDASSDEAYSADVRRWAVEVGETFGLPEHAVFQSWVESIDGERRVPVNLPEDDPAIHSHTRLINDGLALLRGRGP